MSGTTPFRGLTAPSSIARVNPSREFGKAYGDAEDAFKNARMKCVGLIVLALALFWGAASYTLPRIISQFGTDAHADSCIISQVGPYCALLIAGTIITAWFFMQGIVLVRPFRHEFQVLEDDLRAIRKFNFDVARVHFDILEFETSTEERKREIVDEAMRLESLRWQMLWLAKVRHER